MLKAKIGNVVQFGSVFSVDVTINGWTLPLYIPAYKCSIEKAKQRAIKKLEKITRKTVEVVK